MNPSIQVRPATPDDVPFLVDCNAAMARETEHKALDILRAAELVEEGLE